MPRSNQDITSASNILSRWWEGHVMRKECFHWARQEFMLHFLCDVGQHRRPSLSRAAWDYSLWILSDIVYSTYRTYRKRTGSGIWMRHITWSNRPIEYSFWPMTLCHQCTSLSQFLTRKIHIFFPCHLMSSYQVSILVPGPIDFNDVRLCQSVSHAF